MPKPRWKISSVSSQSSTSTMPESTDDNADSWTEDSLPLIRNGRASADGNVNPSSIITGSVLELQVNPPEATQSDEISNSKSRAENEQPQSAGFPEVVGNGIMETLVTDVSELQVVLAKLQEIFDVSSPESSQKAQLSKDFLLQTHETLRSIRNVLNSLFQKYPFLSCKEVLHATALLVNSIKDLKQDQACIIASGGFSKILDDIGTLQKAVCERVGEYLTWEMNQMDSGIFKGSESMEDILYAGNSATNCRKVPRRSSTFQVHTANSKQKGLSLSPPDTLDPDQVDEVLISLESGVELAFTRAKAWSKYCKEIINFVQRRVELETAHVKQVEKLVLASQEAVQEEAFLPLQSAYLKAFKYELDFGATSSEAMRNLLGHKFITPLEARREEEETKRKVLKENWKKQMKIVKDTALELKKAKKQFLRREDSYLTARQTALKAEHCNASEISKIEKRRRLEEDAMIKHQMAGKGLRALEDRLERRYQELQELKGSIIKEVRELMMMCENATRSYTAAYFQILSELWSPISIQYAELSKEARDYVPGSSYMQFICDFGSTGASTVSSPSAATSAAILSSSASLATGNASLSSASSSSNSCGHHSKSASLLIGASNRASSSDQEFRQTLHGSQFPLSQQNSQLPKSPFSSFYVDLRSNEASPESTPDNEKSKRESLANLPKLSDAALSHNYQKIRLPAKCINCDTYTFFQTVQCTECGIALHKACLPRLSVSCSDASSKKLACFERKMSIFGVPLSTVVRNNANGDLVPSVLKRCVEELDRRGAKIKGLYRICGVKSKIEQLCEDFEREDVDFGEVHPTSIASVVKLYLRQLPEPLLTYDLYTKFIELAKEFPAQPSSNSSRSSICHAANASSNLASVQNNEDQTSRAWISRLKNLIHQLPTVNYQTLKFLILHLKRLTLYQDENGMNAANLGIVFGPSLLWSDGTASLANLLEAPMQTRLVEIIINHTYEIFEVDQRQERIKLESFRRSNEEEVLKDKRQYDRVQNGGTESSHVDNAEISTPTSGININFDDSGFASDCTNPRIKSATPDLLKSRPIIERTRSASTSTGGTLPDSEDQHSEEELNNNHIILVKPQGKSNRYSFPMRGDIELLQPITSDLPAHEQDSPESFVKLRNSGLKSTPVANDVIRDSTRSHNQSSDSEYTAGNIIRINSGSSGSPIERTEQARKPLYRRAHNKVAAVASPHTNPRLSENRKSLPIISILCDDATADAETSIMFDSNGMAAFNPIARINNHPSSQLLQQQDNAVKLRRPQHLQTDSAKKQAIKQKHHSQTFFSRSRTLADVSSSDALAAGNPLTSSLSAGPFITTLQLDSTQAKVDPSSSPGRFSMQQQMKRHSLLKSSENNNASKSSNSALKLNSLLFNANKGAQPTMIRLDL